MTTSKIEFIQPDWSAPHSIQAVSSTRFGGVSLAPYDSFNLATHVQDQWAHVLQNRQILEQSLNLSSSIAWLDQQHTHQCLYCHQAWSSPPTADAVWTDQPGLVMAVLTADCLPILITNQAGSLVCAVHAGWRGLLNGVVQNTVRQLPEKAENLLAWIGPAISQTHFQVGAEVYQAFTQQDVNFQTAFVRDKNNDEAEEKWLADLPMMAQQILLKLGVGRVTKSGLCTYDDVRFYSYRKEGQTGRIASLIWIDSQN